MSIKAKVTVEFILDDVCNEEDLVGITFDTMVRYLILEEGIYGIASEEKVIKVERIE